ncbi:MAG TPA: carboxypeptidase-like regulatory domain-containing protein, partial [Longimicrobiales bacterium]|nr:carboxypeptidase-like regulatory domain-containing protein [Longimicrobiales bacterium]
MPSARSALLLLAAAAVLLRPTPTAAQDHRHALTGRVLAAESGAPLAAALVRIPNSRHRVLTDQNGRFRIAGLLPGTYPLRIETIARSSVDTAAVAGPD